MGNEQKTTIVVNAYKHYEETAEKAQEKNTFPINVHQLITGDYGNTSVCYSDQASFVQEYHPLVRPQYMCL